MDCIFCKIANGEIPCKKVYEDENVIAFTWRSFHEMASGLIVCFYEKHLERKRSHHYGNLSHSNW